MLRPLPSSRVARRNAFLLIALLLASCGGGAPKAEEARPVAPATPAALSEAKPAEPAPEPPQQEPAKPSPDALGFPKAGWSSDQGEFAVQALVQAHDQARAQDCVRPRWRDIQFRG